MEICALKIGYREMDMPFWDALISRYLRPMTNGPYVNVLLKKLISRYSISVGGCSLDLRI